MANKPFPKIPPKVTPPVVVPKHQVSAPRITRTGVTKPIAPRITHTGVTKPK